MVQMPGVTCKSVLSLTTSSTSAVQFRMKSPTAVAEQSYSLIQTSLRSPILDISPLLAFRHFTDPAYVANRPRIAVTTFVTNSNVF